MEPDSAERVRRSPLARVASHVAGSHSALLFLALACLVAAALSAGFIRVKPASAVTWQAGSSGPFSVAPLDIRPVDPWPAPSHMAAEPRHDAPVPMFDSGGAVWEHPSLQLQFGLALLAAYDDTGDARYLSAAERLADHLLGYAVTSRDALFFPYAFVWWGSDPPWYSALSQGKGLAFFGRLWERTGSDRWSGAAHAIFRSFTLDPSATDPWVAFVDERGNLWLEEYPGGDVPAQVLNGHITAVFGLYEYARIFDSPDADRLVRGGLTTVIERGPDYEVLGDYSYYGLRDAVQKPNYHAAHIRQLAVLIEMTGSPALASLRDALARDSDWAPQRGTVATWLVVASAALLGLALVWRPHGVIGPAKGGGSTAAG